MHTIKSRKTILPILLILVLAVSLPAIASTRDEIEETQYERQYTKDRMVSAQERLAALEAKKGDTEAYLTELVSQMDSLAAEFEDLQNQYDAKALELAALQDDYEAALQQEKEQYDDMKLRIQYLYESNTGTGALEVLFSGETITDFLSRSEAISQIHAYDRALMSEYEDTRKNIEERRQKLLEEQEKITGLQEECTGKKNEIHELYSLAYVEMEECLNGISSAQNELNALAENLSAQDARLQGLLTRYYNEEGVNYAGSYVIPENISASGSAEGMNLTYLGYFTLTAYCPCPLCNGPYTGTASGAPLTSGHTVAMGGLPFGTKLYINGTIYTVEDRGTPYGWVDIYFDTHEETEAFGMRYADVYLVN